MSSLAVVAIEPGVYRGNPSANLYLSGEGYRSGTWMTNREVVENLISYGVPYIHITGADPFEQSVLSVLGLCYILKKWYRKKVIVETSGNRFNALLFLNVKHFCLHPRAGRFRGEMFERYIKYSSYKTLELGKTLDLTPSSKTTRYNYTKFVEVVFDIRQEGDMDFAHHVYADYKVKEALVKTYIKRDPAYPMALFGKDWKEYQEKFLPSNHLYCVE
jgi:hypothetical protein